jgi:hypothetical protein
MAKDENGKIDNVPSTDMSNEELLAFSKDERRILSLRFEALVLLTERMYFKCPHQ